MLRSACSDFVGMPVDGPPRITSTTTIGISAAVEPERFDHQRETGPRRRGQRRRTAERSANDHVDRSQLVFGLQQNAADLGKSGRQPFENFARRRYGVGGGETDAAADGTETRRLVA